MSGGLAYLRYQLRDFLLLRALLPVGLVVLVAYAMLKTTPATMDWSARGGGQRALAEMFRMLASLFLPLAAFLGIARLVADDRSNGYFRLLFSKPVAIERFYVQAWLLHGMGLVALTGMLALWLQALTGPVPIFGAMAAMALTWVLVGGVGFLLSAATNHDALLLVLVFVVSTILQTITATSPVPVAAWVRQLSRAMMPMRQLDVVHGQLYAGLPVPWAETVHVLAYGGLAFMAGVIMLRRTSFAR